MVRQWLKYLLHNIFCPALMLLSADRILGIAARHKRLIIMYHGVRKHGQRINARHITSEHFDRQLRYFARHFNVVPLREICEMKTRGIVPGRRTIALTFDDGFLNNLTVALPLLRQYRMPATLFLCSAAVEDPSYVHPADLIDLIRTTGGNDKVQIGDEIFVRHHHRLMSVTTGSDATNYVRSQPLDRWHTLMNSLQQQIDFIKSVTVDEELYKLIEATSLKELTEDDLVEVGSHCHHHVDLTWLREEEVDLELALAKKVLAEHTAKPVESIAFPYGSYNRMVVNRVRALGFRYLIAGGDVPPEFSSDVFPRIGVLDGGSFSHTILSIARGFRRFGF